MALCADTPPRLQRLIAESRNNDLNATQSQPRNPVTSDLFSLREVDSRPLPVKLKLLVSLADVLTLKSEVSTNFEPVSQKGVALG